MRKFITIQGKNARDEKEQITLSTDEFPKWNDCVSNKTELDMTNAFFIFHIMTAPSGTKPAL